MRGFLIFNFEKRLIRYVDLVGAIDLSFESLSLTF